MPDTTLFPAIVPSVDEDPEPPIDPTDMTVAELRDALDGPDDWGTPALRGLREAETEGDNRETALDAIDAALEEQEE